IPFAALLSSGAPTAKVLPSPLSATMSPNLSSSPGFEALIYATCLKLDAVAAAAEERAGACAAGWTVNAATASHSGHILETYFILLPPPEKCTRRGIQISGPSGPPRRA